MGRPTSTERCSFPRLPKGPAVHAVVSTTLSRADSALSSPAGALGPTRRRASALIIPVASRTTWRAAVSLGLRGDGGAPAGPGRPGAPSQTTAPLMSSNSMPRGSAAAL